MSAHIFSDRPYWRGISPGDTVGCVTTHGSKLRGKVVISLPTHVVINIGGRHGTPCVVDENNFSFHTPAKVPKPRKKKTP